MNGHEIDIQDLPMNTALDLAHDLVEVVAHQSAKIAEQAQRIEDLERQLYNERRVSGDVADAELWRAGALT